MYRFSAYVLIPLMSLCPYIVLSQTNSTVIGKATTVPVKVGYQGYLADVNGNPVEGTKTITFRIYASSSGGASLFEQTKIATVNSGIFAVLLDVPQSIFNGSERYLSVEVENDGEMTPRQNIAPVPYAYRAGNVSWYDIENVPTGFADGIDNTGSSGGTSTVILGTYTGGDAGFINIKGSVSYDVINMGKYTEGMGFIIINENDGEAAVYLSSFVGVGGGIIRVNNESGKYVGSLTAGTGQQGYFELLGPTEKKTLMANWITGGGGVLQLFDASENAAIELWGHSGTIVARTKNFKQPHPTDPSKDIYYASIEGPEAAAYVRGTAHLVNGETTIILPDHFEFVTSGTGLTVQLTPLSENSKGLAATEKTNRKIIVRELLGGTGNYDFDYFVSGVRKGYENYKVIRDKVDQPALVKKTVDEMGHPVPTPPMNPQ